MNVINHAGASISIDDEGNILLQPAPGKRTILGRHGEISDAGFTSGVLDGNGKDITWAFVTSNDNLNGLDDPVCLYGFNQQRGTPDGRQDPTRESVGIGMESRYRATGIGVTPEHVLAEWYYFRRTPEGHYTRPYGGVSRINADPDGKFPARFGVFGEWTQSDTDGTQRYLFWANGVLYAFAGSYLQAENNAVWLYQKNAAGDNSVSVGMVDGQNRTVIGGTAGMTSPGSIFATAGFNPPAMSDEQAANNTLYYSTNVGKLSYKNPDGVISRQNDTPP